MTTSALPASPSRRESIADQTGPLSFVGLANANVARMVIDDINAEGGLLGRHRRAPARGQRDRRRRRGRQGAKLVEEDQVDVLLGGIYSSTRQAIKGPAVVEGRTLYIYPEQYEGQESDPLIFCTGPVPAQQVDPFIPWLMRETGAKTFYLPSADYIWPHVLNARVREVVTANGGAIVGEEYFPSTTPTTGRRSTGSSRAAPTWCSTRSSRPGLTPFFEQLHDVRLHRAAADSSSARTSTRTSSTWCRPRTWRGCTAASTTTRPSTTRSAGSCSPGTTPSTPVTPSSPAAAPARACTAASGSGRRR